MRTILVTGANRGIGLAFVRLLARYEPTPAFVFATCRSPDTAKELQDLAATHTHVRILKIDVQNESTYGPAVEAVSSLVGENGLNVLINNAGVYSRDGYETVTREYLTSIFEINIIGPIRITQAFLPLLKRGARNSKIERFSIERAAVINMASKMGSISLNTSGGAAGSRESKAALNMFTRGLSIELKTDKILVVSQCPGWVSTLAGGPDAPKTPEISVSEMLQIFALYSEEHTGCYLDNQIPLTFSQY
ncbi:C-signal-like isoform X1 [Lytechinus pictus]|uniref:C-signal-like isoform X1 n=1 Tax=Lytechinus pictus TaxID=7653 RepID=UPI00240E48D0|nr:C-factor-like [Lytechinus pictus]